jgi:hypothetical protein
MPAEIAPAGGELRQAARAAAPSRKVTVTVEFMFYWPVRVIRVLAGFDLKWLALQ